MRRVLILLVIVGAFAGSAVCLAQSESEISVESGEKAIEVIMEELKKNPPKKLKRPPYPVRIKK